jgi:8-hydroxy-5-deazaflavin:NADPH oxidoreductase
MRIGVIGGTGSEGRGLALRWARAGHHVAIGSRNAERARERAAEIAALAPQGVVAGGDNAWAVADAEVVLLSVPYDAHEATLQEHQAGLQGRVLIDITVPLKPPRVSEVHLPPGQSAALEAQAILGAGVKVVAALHHVSAAHLVDPGYTIDCDVLVCANDADARALVIGLIGDLGLRGFDAGTLKNAVALESLTAVLIHLNKRYKSKGSGIRITGIP